MDIQMPVMNGWEATKAIRLLENPHIARIPIIALSADSFESNQKMSLECGMDAHLNKPLDVDCLLKPWQRSYPSTNAYSLKKDRSQISSGCDPFLSIPSL